MATTAVTYRLGRANHDNQPMTTSTVKITAMIHSSISQVSPSSSAKRAAMPASQMKSPPTYWRGTGTSRSRNGALWSTLSRASRHYPPPRRTGQTRSSTSSHTADPASYPTKDRWATVSKMPVHFAPSAKDPGALSLGARLAKPARQREANSQRGCAARHTMERGCQMSTFLCIRIGERLV
ncbi:hypothetical protein PCL_10485 [Purpureocillium lilacinum]|uniref:Uncharacterized protein n=1 Tax=Purpureocillium lilacinum TaxID=33203 RepID=A0A2U3DQ83_PURLI|nr:hypothetical protein PCL_10485 [Purpureocillium lilacinum]